jgi:glycosyltransferase involved in cell wall biosynthesis
LRILFIDQNFDATNIGGAFKSNYAIINELIKNPDYTISILASKASYRERENFISKSIYPILRTPSKKINKLIKYFRINQFFSIFSIFREIKQFKPDVIVVQRELTFSAVFVGFLKKVPVINIIRDGMEFCPKDIDTRGFKNCSNLLKRNECWKCINRWRTMRILLDDKPIGFNKTSLSSFYTIYYKIRFFIIKIYMVLLRYTYVNIVASPLMKELVEKRLKRNRILIKKITPIDNSKIQKLSNKIKREFLDKIENSNNKILFVIPRNESGSKGYPFVKRLLIAFPKHFLLIVVGTIIEELKTYENVINIGKIPTDNLYYLYKKADLTIVPSIYTEAFGRVVLESIINKTPVLTSPQTGANYLFKDKEYVKVLPLNNSIWNKEIRRILENPILIPDKDVKFFENMFSPQECAKEIVNILENIKL